MNGDQPSIGPDASAPPLPVAPALPPLIQYPSSGPPKRPSRGWMVLSLILLAVVAVLLWGRITFSLNTLGPSRLHARTGGIHLQEVVVEDHRAVDKIAIVDIEGIITGSIIDGGVNNMVSLIREQLLELEKQVINGTLNPYKAAGVLFNPQTP